MRKGTKRKASQKEEVKSPEDSTNMEPIKSTEETNKESRKAVRRAKPVKASKPESKPEFFEEKRNLKLCFVGEKIQGLGISSCVGLVSEI
ncbi:hypothetical protein U1Q18_020067 [Sarracenia purpurea var. burkii]